jgi:uncharacterized protein YbjT (DUF2867 family)
MIVGRYKYAISCIVHPSHSSIRNIDKRSQDSRIIQFTAPTIFTMTTIHKVALAGASSDVGRGFLQALLDADFEVTVLTRAGSNTTFPSSVKTVNVDYTSIANLTEALKGQDALVSNLGAAAFDLQANLIDAVVAAKVKRFIPSDFGSDMMNPRARTLPVFAPKIKIDELTAEKLKGTESTWTIVFNNAFLDWGIEHKMLMDLSNKKFMMIDGGVRPFTTTPVPLVGKAIAHVLKRADETAGKVVRIQGIAITQKRLLEIAQGVVGKEGWTIDEFASEALEKNSYEKLNENPQDVMGWMMGFLARAIYGEGYGGDFTENNDNKLLGLEELSENDVEEIIRKIAA